jgi:rhodanese-related sulfurtransferase
MRNVLAILLIAGALFASYMAPERVPGAQTIDSETAYAMFQKNVKFIDVRPERFVLEGKVKNAYHLYVDEFSKQKLNAIAATKEEIVVYCNGLGCPLSAEAILKAVGYGYTKIYYYRDGYPAWKYYNLPVE